MLPHSSVATHVLVIVRARGPIPPTDTSVKLTSGAESQLSVAVGVVHAGVAEHSIVEGPGKPEITGGVVSSTLIV